MRLNVIIRAMQKSDTQENKCRQVAIKSLHVQFLAPQKTLT